VTIGAVLVGGAGTRMGTDKSLLDVAGAPLGRRAVDALRGAGVDDVLLIGGDDRHAAALGGRAVEDIWPGEGPVGGLLTALHAAFLAGGARVMCLSCDLPAVTSDAVGAVLGSTPAGRASVVAVNGVAAPPNGVWPISLLPALEERFADGADSFRGLLDGLELPLVEGGRAFADADEPGDLDEFL
jgi:molybdopterin-guanine dinucleotide biosynthesis protein A